MVKGLCCHNTPKPIIVPGLILSSLLRAFDKNILYFVVLLMFNVTFVTSLLRRVIQITRFNVEEFDSHVISTLQGKEHTHVQVVQVLPRRQWLLPKHPAQPCLITWHESNPLALRSLGSETASACSTRIVAHFPICQLGNTELGLPLKDLFADCLCDCFRDSRHSNVLITNSLGSPNLVAKRL